MIEESIFEGAYKEYKEYETFYNGKLPEIVKKRENFQKFVTENQDDTELLVNMLFDINEKPFHYQNDLVKLQQRLITIYEAYKHLIKVPEDISKEIEGMPKVRTLFFIKDGEAISVDETLTKEIKETTKKSYIDFVQNLLKSNIG